MDFFNASHVIRWYSGEDLSSISRIICASLNGGTYAPPARPLVLFFTTKGFVVFFASLSVVFTLPLSSR